MSSTPPDRCHRLPDAARQPPGDLRVQGERVSLVSVIYMSALRGDGTAANPLREVDLYYSHDGELLACMDPLDWAAPLSEDEGACWADVPVPSAHNGYRAACLRLFGRVEPYLAKRARQALSVAWRGKARDAA